MNKFIKIIARNLIFFFYGNELSLFAKIRLKLAPRYKSGTLQLAGKTIEYTDAASFVSMYEELFIKKIYDFRSDNPTPFIVDCGANIGLSIIYFKSIFPNANIIAFEPDEKIFDILSKNITSFAYSGVELRKQAIWKANEVLSFQSQGGLSGQIISTGLSNTISVEGFRLKDLLTRPIDFLKIDIEGAEYEVIMDCKYELKNIHFLFVEYHSTIGQPQKLNEILNAFTEAGFRYYIQEAFTSNNPFMEVRTMLDMDLQLNVFGIKP